MQPLGWFILACVVVTLIIYGVIASKVSEAKRTRERRARLPDVDPPLLAGKTYNIQLSHGRMLHGVTILGMGAEVHNRE